MKIQRYAPEMKPQWDVFVDSSKNGTFLLKRDYMEYHADRFPDNSFVYTDENDNFLALLPATRHGDVLSSHAGLTYGGLIMSDSTSATDPLAMFALLREEMKCSGLRQLVYKPIPHIYHRQGAEEDLYALFRNDARLIVRNISTVINLRDPLPSGRLGWKAQKRQAKSGILVSEVGNVDRFWEMATENLLMRHKVRPVHTASELNYLKSCFPDNIRFFIATDPDDEVLASAVIYLDRQVIHLQYASSTPKGKKLYATDVIYHELIHKLLPGNNYFDFGISNEDGGRYLNEGLAHHKEEFGGRSVVYDTYRIEV